jgi:predicted transcriptional regulator
MKQDVSFIVEAGKLPKVLLEALAMPPLPNSRFRITIEELEMTDEEKLAALRTAVQEGLADIESGNVIDSEVVHAELKAKYFPEG